MKREVRVRADTPKTMSELAAKLGCEVGDVVDGLMVIAQGWRPEPAKQFIAKKTAASKTAQLPPEVLDALQPDTEGDGEEIDLEELLAIPGVKPPKDKGAKKVETKPQVYKRMTDAANAIRATEQSLTFEQAFSRAMREQPELYQQYCEAPDAEEFSEDSSEPGPWKGRATEKLVHDQILTRASALRQSRPTLSAAQAFTEIWMTDSAVREKYRLAERVDQRAQQNAE